MVSIRSVRFDEQQVGTTDLNHEPASFFGFVKRNFFATESDPDRRDPTSDQSQDTQGQDTPDPPKNVPEGVGPVANEPNREVLIWEEDCLSRRYGGTWEIFRFEFASTA